MTNLQWTGTHPLDHLEGYPGSKRASHSSRVQPSNRSIAPAADCVLAGIDLIGKTVT
jgi:hypothetical protein